MSFDIAAIAREAKESCHLLRFVSEEQRVESIKAIGRKLEGATATILAANQLDLADAAAQNLSRALIDRLCLNESRIKNLLQGLEQIASAPAVVGQIESQNTRSDGLIIERKRIPLGVIAVIFESRPNVLIDCAAIAIKSGNAILLKGGSDAKHSNAILGKLVRDAVKPYLPEGCIQIIPAGDRQLTIEMVKLAGLIDLVIPRGGEGLIRMIQEHARVPIIAHAKGLCHLYLHSDAIADLAMAITLNAKAQRPGVCNAIETLLVHRSLAVTQLLPLMMRLQSVDVSLRVDAEILRSFPNQNLTLATEEDWNTEYLENILSIRLVDNEDAAIAHILRYGSQHTEGIVAQDKAVIQKFEMALDSSCIAVNASTRFNDGGELGLGAEIGISTSKLHAFGPMGSKELTTLRYIVRGQGHVRL